MTLLDFQRRNDGLVVNGPDQVTIFTSPSLAFDGSTRMKIEFYTPGADALNFADANILILEDGVSIGDLARFTSVWTQGYRVSGYGVAYYTPPAGSHVYDVVVDNEGNASWQLSFDYNWYRLSTSPATELSYVERLTNFTPSGTFITADPVVLDGSTRIRVETYAAYLKHPGDSVLYDIELLDNGGSVATFGQYRYDHEYGGPLYLAHYLTPSAGSHEYSITIDGMTVLIGFPAFIRVTDDD